MGSFNVSCSVSGVSIRPGDSVVIFLLLPRERPMMIDALPYLSEVNHYFNPFCFPVRCVYKDYGEVREVEESENVRSVESFFGLSIERIVRRIVNGRDSSLSVGEEALRILSSLSLMYVHGDVYKAMVDVDFCPSRGEEIDIPKILGELSQELYDFDGTHKIMESYTFPSIEEQRRNFEFFNRAAGKNPGFVPTEFKPEPEGTKMEFERVGYRDDPENDPLGSFALTFNPLLCFYKEWPYFATLYREAIRGNHLADNFAEYSFFVKRMHSCSKFFSPALNGEQWGNNKASKSLAEVTLAILNKR